MEKFSVIGYGGFYAIYYIENGKMVIPCSRFRSFAAAQKHADKRNAKSA